MKGEADEALAGRAAQPPTARRRTRAAARVSRYREVEARREGTEALSSLGAGSGSWLGWDRGGSSGLVADRGSREPCWAPFFSRRISWWASYSNKLETGSRPSYAAGHSCRPVESAVGSDFVYARHQLGPV